MKWVILPIEIKSRELIARILVAHHLIQNGYGVIITKWGPHGSIVDALPTGLWLVNNLLPGIRHCISQLRRNGNVIHVSDEEGLFARSEKAYMTRILSDNYRTIHKVYCWNKKQKEWIDKVYPDQRNKTLLIGNPRLNVLRPMFSELYSTSVGQLQNQYNKIILIVGRFSLRLAGSEEEPENAFAFLLHTMRLNGLISSLEDETVLRARFDHYEAIAKAFQNIIHDIAKSYPSCTVLIRPHPCESQTIWKGIANQYPNVSVEADGSLTNLVKSSKVVIQYNSTSALECLLSNIPSISYAPAQYEGEMSPLFEKISIYTRTKQDLLKELDKVLSTGTNPYADQYASFLEILQKHSVNTSSDSAAIAVTDAIINEPLPDVSFSLFAFWIRRSVHLVSRWSSGRSKKQRAERKQGASREHPWIKRYHLYAKQKYAGITRCEIKQLLSAYNDIYGVRNQYSVRCYASRVFVLCPLDVDKRKRGRILSCVKSILDAVRDGSRLLITDGLSRHYAKAHYRRVCLWASVLPMYEAAYFRARSLIARELNLDAIKHLEHFVDKADREQCIPRRNMNMGRLGFALLLLGKLRKTCGDYECALCDFRRCLDISEKSRAITAKPQTDVVASALFHMGEIQFQNRWEDHGLSALSQCVEATNERHVKAMKYLTILRSRALQDDVALRVQQ